MNIKFITTFVVFGIAVLQVNAAEWNAPFVTAMVAKNFDAAQLIASAAQKDDQAKSQLIAMKVMWKKAGKNVDELFSANIGGDVILPMPEGNFTGKELALEQARMLFMSPEKIKHVIVGTKVNQNPSENDKKAATPGYSLLFQANCKGTINKVVDALICEE